MSACLCCRPPSTLLFSCTHILGPNGVATSALASSVLARAFQAAPQSLRHRRAPGVLGSRWWSFLARRTVHTGSAGSRVPTTDSAVGSGPCWSVKTELCAEGTPVWVGPQDRPICLMEETVTLLLCHCSGCPPRCSQPFSPHMWHFSVAQPAVCEGAG